MSPLRRVLRNTAIQVGGEALSKVASLAFYVVLARELGTAGFGTFTYSLSLGLMLMSVAGLGIDDLIVRDGARDRSREPRLLVDALTAKAVTGGLALLLAVAIAIFVDTPGEAGGAAIVLLALAALVEQIVSSVGSVLEGRERFAAVNVAVVAQRWLTALAGVCAVLLGAGVLAACVSYLAGALVALVTVTLALRRAGVGRLPPPSRESARALALMSLPIGVSGMFTVVLFRVDATMLAALQDTSAVGLYGAAYRLLETTLTVSFAAVGALAPMLARLSLSEPSRLRELYQTACKALLALLLPVGAGFVLFAAPIVELLYGPEYREAVLALRLLGGAAALYGLSYLSTYVLISVDRQRLIPLITGVGALLNILLNLVAIPLYSLDGAAAVTSITQLGLVLGTGALTLRAVGAISLGAVFCGPLLGCAAMVGLVLLLGDSLVLIPVAGAAYVAVFLSWEHWRDPQELRAAMDALRGRPPTERPQGAR